MDRKQIIDQGQDREKEEVRVWCDGCYDMVNNRNSLNYSL